MIQGFQERGVEGSMGQPGVDVTHGWEKRRGEGFQRQGTSIAEYHTEKKVEIGQNWKRNSRSEDFENWKDGGQKRKSFHHQRVKVLRKVETELVEGGEEEVEDDVRTDGRVQKSVRLKVVPGLGGDPCILRLV